MAKPSHAFFIAENNSVGFVWEWGRVHMADVLEVTGIDSKGYGKIYKSVMRDRNLPIYSKALYAYLCSYAGCGVTAFPKRAKVMRDLSISKDTFTEYMHVLVLSGYIGKQRTASGNLYTIRMDVPLKTMAEEVEPSSDVLRFDNVRAQGYGTVPKLVMLDSRLTAKSKAIYAYFCSFTGAGTIAFPRKTTVMRELGLGEKGYYSHFKLLTRYGYISVKQRKNNGRFDVSEYHLNEEVAGHTSEEPVDNQVNHVENSPLSGFGMSGTSGSGKGKSGFGMSGGSVPATTGHANIKNTSIINSPINNNLQDKEHEEYQQPLGSADEKELAHEACSLERVKALIGIAQLRKEIDASISLKLMLKQFMDAHDMERYERVALEVVRELPKQIYAFLQRKGSVVVLNGQQYDMERLQENLFACLNDEQMSALCLNIAERYQTIHSVKEYLKKTVINLAICGP